MKRILFILICALSFIVTPAQKKPFYLKVDAPEYLPVNSTFEVSLLTKIIPEDITSVKLYILIDDKVRMKRVEHVMGEKANELITKYHALHDYFGKSYEINLLQLNPDVIFDTPFQLRLLFEPYSNDLIEIGYGFEYVMKNGRVERYSSFTGYEYDVPVSYVAFYEPQQIAGKALSVNNGAKFELSLADKNIENNLLIEFWKKSNKSSGAFFNIFDSKSLDTLFSVGRTKGNVVTINCPGDLSTNRNKIVGNNEWAFYSLLYSKAANTFELYVNGKSVYTSRINGFIDYRNLSLAFLNGSKGNYEVDMLRVWDFDDSLSTTFENKNFTTYQTENSRLVYSFLFDENNFAYNNKSIRTNAAKLVVSDAPLFSRAPELNVNVYDNFYSVEWVSNDVKNAEIYQVEKAMDDKPFEQISETFADPNPDKTYYFSDRIDPSAEVVYYRIKQINKDGTSTYSAQVKIGQGEVTEFKLEQNYPNPFNPETTISVEVLITGDYHVAVYDLVGKKIETLYRGTLSTGMHSFMFNGAGLPSGIYFLEVKTSTTNEVMKMILAK